MKLKRTWCWPNCADGFASMVAVPAALAKPASGEGKDGSFTQNWSLGTDTLRPVMGVLALFLTTMKTLTGSFRVTLGRLAVTWMSRPGGGVAAGVAVGLASASSNTHAATKSPAAPTR